MDVSIGAMLESLIWDSLEVSELPVLIQSTEGLPGTRENESIEADGRA